MDGKGEAPPHALVVGQEAHTLVKAQGLRAIHLETGSEWVCGDFGEVVLHLFTAEAREYYDLEALWADAEKISWSPAVPA